MWVAKIAIGTRYGAVRGICLRDIGYVVHVWRWVLIEKKYRGGGLVVDRWWHGRSNRAAGTDHDGLTSVHHGVPAGVGEGQVTGGSRVLPTAAGKAPGPSLGKEANYPIFCPWMGGDWVAAVGGADVGTPGPASRRDQTGAACQATRSTIIQ